MPFGSFLLASVAAVSVAYAGGPPAEATAAFDRYVKLSEAAVQARSSAEDLLWLDQHRKEKTMVWMNQDFLISPETLDHDKKENVPGASIQHWLGAVYLETAKLERVAFVLLNYAAYKNSFPEQIIESRLIKRDGNHFDASLRLRKKQITQVVLRADLSSDYNLVDPERATITTRFTRIGEAEHGSKNKSDQETADNPSDYLWGLNVYWRLEQADPGVYAEVELISLAPTKGTLHPGRYLNGFQTFPRELARGFLDGLTRAFPPLRK